MITLNPEQSLFLLFAYFFAAIPFGVLVGLAASGKDVRSFGSGNTGATNVARSFGKKWGLLVLLLDGLKGYLVVVIAAHFGGVRFENLAGALAVLAHCYPIYLGFKGGKGVATTLGVLFALSPIVVAVAAGIFLIFFLGSRRISPGSLAAAASLPLVAGLRPNRLSLWTALFLVVLIWWKHRENIVRIWKRDEPFFF